MASADVSVIVPNYNHAKFLQRRMDSILDQTFRNYEIIILDDCSTDNSKTIIEQYRGVEAVKHIIYNDKNSGTPFSQWKKGLQLAKGKFIWLAESDDCSDSMFLEKMVSVLEENKKVGLVFCNSYSVDEDGNILQKWTFTTHRDCRLPSICLLNGRKFFFNHLVYRNVIPNASAVLFRREIVAGDLDWIADDLKNSGDWKLWLNISLHKDVAYVNEALNFFRKHGNNVTRSVELLNKEAILILKDFLPVASTLKEKFQICQSLLVWSFQQAPWLLGHEFNIANLNSYLKNNLSVVSLYSLFMYYVKAVAKNYLKLALPRSIRYDRLKSS